MLEGDEHGDEAFAPFLRPHPRAFRQNMCPHPREFAQFFLKNANARGLARGGGGRALLELTDALRPVYTGDFCRGNSMQFLSRSSCNFKIARVNQMRFSVRFVAAISQGFRTCLKLVATLAREKLHRVAATKIACVNGPLGRG